ncbi:hypothetical protein Pint_19108 [Pistacia integerrima]|uniref:Uncharacterized protein n=1 Tax=Pistacia integerrima TaxID=434235 RepID=A0ACC0YXQ0_9ROSI|nr:hypothetical protein Pint_19108 [Pistacia integerrima]
MAQPFYAKQLARSDVGNKLAVENSHLEDFPPFPPGQNFQNLPFLDEEFNTMWNLRLAVRRNGAYLKPTIGGNWRQFCRTRGLQAGQFIMFFREINAETGEVGSEAESVGGWVGGGECGGCGKLMTMTMAKNSLAMAAAAMAMAKNSLAMTVGGCGWCSG